jgi:F0F1-type ATP synthase beta subunit
MDADGRRQEIAAMVKAILEGKADDVPEDALLFVGSLDDVTAG